MQLSDLLQPYYSLSRDADRSITGLALDSRHLQPEQVFCALKGQQMNGEDYIPMAISKGAAAVLIEAAGESETLTWQGNIPLIRLSGLAKKVGLLAARFFDFPARSLHMVGVTGTSGKTSCTHFLAQSFDRLQWPCGIIGTLGSGFYGDLGEAGLTTPDAITLQSALHQFVRHHAKAVAMEVSSHSIDQERINGIEFETGIFTNLSRDHLDYHGDMASYAAVKRRFLEEMPIKQLVINADDAYGLSWIKAWYPQKTIIAYGISKPGSLPAEIPFVHAHHLDLSLEGIRAAVDTPWGEGVLHLPLIGQFNLSNALAVLASLCLSGIDFDQALSCLAALESVPGRMQTLGEGPGQPLIVVDYAHKPEALQKVLQVLRAHTVGKLICIFGCGGDRDRGKRPLMANIAETLADQIIVTDDNPRHEKSAAIIAEVMSGFSHPERVTIEPDRSKAIQIGIQWATAKDCVLIAGKGAERYQQIGEKKYPFDDVEEARKYL